MSRPGQVHVGTVAVEDLPFYTAAVRWLRRRGYQVLATPATPLPAKLAAARQGELCLVLLSGTPGPTAPDSLFTDLELEIDAAADSDPRKVLIFALPSVDQPATPEQQECIQRWRHFAGGTFQATCTTPKALIQHLRAALRHWRDRVPPTFADAVMISSTGDLIAERTAVRQALQRRHRPFIDYQVAASEATPPLERVVTWAQQCQALILILGHRYGFLSPNDGLGVTELEFVTALRAGHPIIAFWGPTAHTTTDPDQQQFFERVRHYLPPTHLRSFTTPRDLFRQVYQMIPWLVRAGSTPLPPPTAAQAQQWYTRQVQRWLGTMPVPGTTLTVPLTDANVYLTTLSPAQFPPVVRGPLTTLFATEPPSTIPREAPADVVQHHPRLLIHGGPGSGKSVLLHWLALQILPERVPVVLALTAYAAARRAGHVTDLLHYLMQEEQRLLLAVPSQPSRWLTMLQAGQGLVALDQVEGVPAAELPALAEDIARLGSALPRATPIILAARPRTALPLPDGFTTRALAPLLPGQRQDLMARWVQALHGPTLTEEALRGRVIKLILQLRGLETWSEWTQSPLLLGLYTLINDQHSGDDIFQHLSDPDVYRRVLRLLLTQGTPPRYLREKETILWHLASQHLGAEAPLAFPQAALMAAGTALALPPALLTRLVLDLDQIQGLLVPTEAGYALPNPSFWTYLVGRWLAGQPWERTADLVLRRRLGDDWVAVTSALTTEWDRTGHPEAVDRLIARLLAGDAAPLFAAGVADPLHKALMLATQCQGIRPAPQLTNATAQTLAHRWGDLYRQRTSFLYKRVNWWLFQLGPAAAEEWETVLTGLDDPTNPTFRNEGLLVIRRLAQYGDARARKELARREPEPGLDRADVRRFDAPLATLGAHLTATEAPIRGAAAMNLRNFGPVARPYLATLITLLTDPVERNRQEAAAAIQAIGPAAGAAIPALLDLALQTTNFAAAGAARAALQQIVRDPHLALPAITAALTSSDPARQDEACYTAMWVPGLTPLLVPTLMPRLLHDQRLRSAAGTALAAAEADISAAFTEIRLRLRHPDEAVQRDALDLVYALRGLAAPMLPDILPLVEHAQLAAAAAQALSRLGPRAASITVPILAQICTSVSTRMAALRALAEIGPLAHEAVPALCYLLSRADLTTADHRQMLATIQAIRPLPTDPLLAALSPFFTAEEPGVRVAALVAASFCQPPLPPPFLAALMQGYAVAGEAERSALLSRLDHVFATVADAGVPETDTPFSPQASLKR